MPQSARICALGVSNRNLGNAQIYMFFLGWGFPKSYEQITNNKFIVLVCMCANIIMRDEQLSSEVVFAQEYTIVSQLQ